jgi:hypothetical protein
MIDQQATRSGRFYRGLLCLLPADFREKWGADAEELMEYRLSAADGAIARTWI